MNSLEVPDGLPELFTLLRPLRRLIEGLLSNSSTDCGNVRPSSIKGHHRQLEPLTFFTDQILFR
jgi:hypothetical protein